MTSPPLIRFQGPYEPHIHLRFDYILLPIGLIVPAAKLNKSRSNEIRDLSWRPRSQVGVSAYSASDNEQLLHIAVGRKGVLIVAQLDYADITFELTEQGRQFVDRGNSVIAIGNAQDAVSEPRK